MSRYSSSTLANGWAAGKPVREALKQFDPKIDGEKLAETERQIQSTSNLGKQNWRKAGIQADELIDGLGKLHLAAAVASDERLSREAQLIAALENSEMVAIGFDASKGAGGTYELVPPFLFQRRFMKGNKSEFSDGACRFANVRIVSIAKLQAKKIGRPSIRRQIFELAELLQAEISDLRPGAQIQKIHRLGKSKFPELFSDGYPSDRAIDRHLKDYWKSNFPK